MTPKQEEVEALTSLLESAGLDTKDLLDAITTLANAKKAVADKAHKNNSNKNILNKELVYPDESAIIYQRGDVKSNVYYFRTYDKQTKKQYVKSLETTDRIKALSTARNLFQIIKGKIEKNERLTSITTQELIKHHLSRYHIKETNKSHIGIAKETFRLKSYYLQKWQEFIEEIGYMKTTIDRIPKNKTRDYGMWFFNQPKRTHDNGKGRSVDQINNSIGEILKMYHKTAVRDRFIGIDQIPEIDRLKEDTDTGYKRDILTEDQYEIFWKYMEYTYMKGKKVDANGNKVRDALAFRDKHELLKRQIFTKAMGVLYNTGLRIGECLLLKWGDISINPSDDEDARKINYRILVRPEVSKTGKKRVIVAPVKKRLDIIKSCYQKMGCDISKDSFILMNPSKDNKPYTRQTLYCRLKRVLKHSGLQAELDKEGKSLTLYASRHFFITMRLRYGKVPLYLLSKVVGTSVKNLTDVYGHIDTEIEAPVITKNMGRLERNGFDIRSKVELQEGD